MSVIQRRYKLYKKFKYSDVKTDKDTFKVAKIILQKMILKKKKSYFEEEPEKTRSKPKILWKTLKSLGLSSDKARKSKFLLRKMAQFNLKYWKMQNLSKGSTLI